MPDSNCENPARHWNQGYLAEVSAKSREEFLGELGLELVCMSRYR
jgi:hypothetical protein